MSFRGSTASARLVYLHLCCRTDPACGEPGERSTRITTAIAGGPPANDVYVSLERIAEQCEMSTRRVSRALAEVERRQRVHLSRVMSAGDVAQIEFEQLLTAEVPA